MIGCRMFRILCMPGKHMNPVVYLVGRSGLQRVPAGHIGMIFKRLWRRRLRSSFGPYVSADSLNQMLMKAQPTDWEAF